MKFSATLQEQLTTRMVPRLQSLHQPQQSSNSTTISGTAPAADGLVHLYQASGGCGSYQADVYIGEATVSAGVWSFSGTFNTSDVYSITYTDDVNNTSRFSLVFGVINTNDTGAGSLRQAIVNSNGNKEETGTILFDITTPSVGPWVLATPASQYPDITTPTIIDGSSQSGFDFANGEMVTLDGGGSIPTGLNIKQAGVEVYGLIIRNFSARAFDLNYNSSGGYQLGAAGKGNIIYSVPEGITISLLKNGYIQGNIIGMDHTGNVGTGQTGHGISAGSSSGTVYIGGPNLADGNSIGGFTGAGKAGIYSNTATLVIQNNYVGTAPDGLTPRPNDVGISLNTASSNTIVDNVVAASANDGLFINLSSSNTIQGNKIGVGSDGTTALGNKKGIHFGSNSTANNVIGGISAGEANIIANSTEEAIVFDNSGTGNQIRGNSIYCNGAGIVLGTANSSLASPTVSGINWSSASGSGLEGAIIDVYMANDGCADDQGQTYLGSTVVSGGVWSWSQLFNPGDVVTAIQTDGSNNSSSFSSTITLPDPPALPTNLISYFQSSTSVNLEWIDNATDESGYVIYSADDYNFTINVQSVVSLPVNSTSYTFNIGANTTKFVYVVALDAIGNETSYSYKQIASTKPFSGSAIELKNDVGYADAGDDGYPQGSESLTIEFWTKTTDASTYFFSYGSQVANGFINLGLNSSGKFYYKSLISATTVNDGIWHHLAFSYDEGTNTSSLYVDGELDATTTSIAAPNIVLSGYMAIGSDVYGGYYLDGFMDEFKVWNFAKADFSDRFTPNLGNESGLVAYYSFDEEQGTKTADRTGIRNEMELHNFNWVPSDFLPTPKLYQPTATSTSGLTVNYLAPASAVDVLVDVSVASDFSSFEVQDYSVGTSGSGLVNAVLSGGTQYYIRAKAIYSGTGQSAYSTSGTFMVEPGNALDFDGTEDYISLTRTTLPSGLTFEAWINTTSTDATSQYGGNSALSIIGDVNNNIRGSFGIHDGKVR